MVRTTPSFVCILLHILILKARSSSLYPYGSFRTVSSSPSCGQFFITFKPQWVVTPHVDYVPATPSKEANSTEQSDLHGLTAKEIDGTEEEDPTEEEKESTAAIQTVVEKNDVTDDETIYYNDSVVSQDNIDYIEDIETVKSKI